MKHSFFPAYPNVTCDLDCFLHFEMQIDEKPASRHQLHRNSFSYRILQVDLENEIRAIHHLQDFELHYDEAEQL